MNPRVKRVLLSPEHDVDRISNLPEPILCHVLSFLPTKYSVRTRILSTRWKYLFTLVPVLEFTGPGRCYGLPNIKPFFDFVIFVFNSYNVNRMDRFIYASSSFLPESEGSQLASLIQDSINRGVKELIVSEIFDEPQTLPRNVLTSETLTVLKLSGDFDIDVPDNVWLPRVRTFYVMGVRFRSDDSVRRLFRSFPVLEELVLMHPKTKNVGVIDICVPSVTSLKIHGIMDEYKLVLDVPNVRYFEYYGSKSHGFSSKNGLISLVHACVNLPMWCIEGFTALPQIFKIISHVQRLDTCCFTLEASERFGVVLPTFQNLTFLKIRIVTDSDFDVGLFVELLDKTPHLDVLVLDDASSGEFEPSVLVPERVPMCVATHLKVIEFQGFSMLEYQWTLVAYFLKNAKFLDKLYIKSKGSLQKQFKMSKKLLTFSRCSRACKIFLDLVDEEEI